MNAKLVSFYIIGLAIVIFFAFSVYQEEAGLQRQRDAIEQQRLEIITDLEILLDAVEVKNDRDLGYLEEAKEVVKQNNERYEAVLDSQQSSIRNV